MATREYIYRGEDSDLLHKVLVNNFGDANVLKTIEEKKKSPLGIIYVFSELNEGWISKKQYFYGWRILHSNQ